MSYPEDSPSPLPSREHADSDLWPEGHVFWVRARDEESALAEVDIKGLVNNRTRVIHIPHCAHRDDFLLLLARTLAAPLLTGYKGELLQKAVGVRLELLCKAGRPTVIAVPAFEHGDYSGVEASVQLAQHRKVRLVLWGDRVDSTWFDHIASSSDITLVAIAHETNPGRCQHKNTALLVQAIAHRNSNGQGQGQRRGVSRICSAMA